MSATSTWTHFDRKKFQAAHSRLVKSLISKAKCNFYINPHSILTSFQFTNWHIITCQFISLIFNDKIECIQWPCMLDFLHLIPLDSFFPTTPPKSIKFHSNLFHWNLQSHFLFKNTMTRLDSPLYTRLNTQDSILDSILKTRLNSHFSFETLPRNIAQLSIISPGSSSGRFFRLFTLYKIFPEICLEKINSELCTVSEGIFPSPFQ